MSRSAILVAQPSRQILTDWKATRMDCKIQFKVRQTCLLGADFELVIVEMFTTKQERKLGIVFLFLLCHLLKLRPISCHKLCHLVDDVLQIIICNNKKSQIKARRNKTLCLLYKLTFSQTARAGILLGFEND